MMISFGRPFGTKKWANERQVTRSELTCEMNAVDAKPVVLQRLVSTAFWLVLCEDVMVLPGYQISMLMMLNGLSVLSAPMICCALWEVELATRQCPQVSTAHTGPPISGCNSPIGLVKAGVACKGSCVVDCKDYWSE
jgi:hypothetical protein